MKRRPRRHEVKAEIVIHNLTKAGTSIRFVVHGQGVKLGEILIGRGSLTWYGGHRKTGYELSWTRFAQLMNAKAYPA